MPRRRALVDPRFPSRLRELRDARGLGVRQLAALAYVSKSTVSGLENGKKTPSLHMVAHLDRALNADGELSAMVTDAPDHHAPQANAPSALEPVAEADRPMGQAELEQLRGSVSQLVALDNAYGSDGICRIPARAFRAAHRKLAAGAYTRKIEQDLRAAVGDMGEVAAWLLYDADQQEESRRLTVEAMMVSRLAGDRSLELLGLANLAMQSVHLRRGREALHVAEHVLDDGHLSPRVAGLFHIRRARALATLGDRPRALDALDQAHALIGVGAGDREPAWAWWIDETELNWHTAMLHSDLGDHSRAVGLFHTTTESHSVFKRRDQYLSRAYLLDELTSIGAWRDAEAVMLSLLAYVDEIGSARTERLLARAVRRMHRTQVPDTLDDLANELAGRMSTAVH